MDKMLLPLLVLLLIVLPVSAAGADVRLSAAASMTDAVRELIRAFEKNTDNVAVLTNFGSSGSLAKQIVQGAPIDIFISANPRWMTYLREQGRVPADRIRSLAGNSLVFVGRKNISVGTVGDLANLQRIAIASPQSTPAGQYAEQALKAAGLYAQLREKLILAKDVRQALIYADRGEVDGAFVYRTDALLAHNADILLEIPSHLHDPVIYPAGLTVEGQANPEAKAFYRFLFSAEAEEILKRYGFEKVRGSRDEEPGTVIQGPRAKD